MANRDVIILHVLVFLEFFTHVAASSYTRDYNDSLNTWNQRKQTYGDCYTYSVNQYNMLGETASTVIKVKEGVVVQRSYEYYDGDSIVVEQWNETTPQTIGTHSSGALPRTMDELYQLCPLYINVDEQSYTVYFNTNEMGLITECGYTPQYCADDCFTGITVSTFTYCPTTKSPTKSPTKTPNKTPTKTPTKSPTHKSTTQPETSYPTFPKPVTWMMATIISTILCIICFVCAVSLLVKCVFIPQKRKKQSADIIQLVANNQGLPALPYPKCGEDSVSENAEHRVTFDVSDSEGLHPTVQKTTRQITTQDQGSCGINVFEGQCTECGKITTGTYGEDELFYCMECWKQWNAYMF